MFRKYEWRAVNIALLAAMIVAPTIGMTLTIFAIFVTWVWFAPTRDEDWL